MRFGLVGTGPWASTIADELVAAALSGHDHEVDLTLGARIVELLAEAQAQIDG